MVKQSTWQRQLCRVVRLWALFLGISLLQVKGFTVFKMKYFFGLPQFSLSLALAQSSSSTSKGSDSGISVSGTAEITSNYIRYGLTQSDRGPAVRGSYLFGLGPQFRVGIASSSVYYQGEDQYLDIEAFADIKIDFSSNVHARLRFGSESYFKSTTRNGENYVIDLNLDKFLVLFKNYKNWEGTEYSTNVFSFGYVWELGANFFSKNLFEYVQVSDPNYLSYFDLFASLEYRSKPMIFAFGGSYTSNSSQFSGRAGPALLVSIGTEF